MIGALSLLALKEGWRQTVKLQLAMDRCTAEVSNEISQISERIEASDTRVKALRVSLAAAGPNPAAIATIKTALTLESLNQKGLQIQYEAQIAAWNARIKCATEVPVTLTRNFASSFPWQTHSDSFGALPLTEKRQTRPAQNRFKLKSQKRTSETIVYLSASGKWTHAWIQ
jgi:hypothetical protein